MSTIMEHEVRTEIVSFRVTEDEWQRLEKAAFAGGAKVRDWCRQMALDMCGKDGGLTRNERLLYEELSRVRFLVGHGFRLLLESDEGTSRAWEEARVMADGKAAEIADQLLAKSRTNAQL